MSYLVANIPPVEVFIDKKFLYDFQKDESGNYLGDGEWEKGHWVSVKSIPNRALLFETYVDKFGFPYLHYSREEQTWVNEFFLFDIKTKTMYISDLVKFDLNKKYGKGYIDNVLLTVVNYWFNKTYKLEVKEIE